MNEEFEKRYIPDFGQKLAHLEGLLGAYLPRRVFDTEVQQKTIDCNKSAFSRLRSGARKAQNWELGRFAELFELNRYGLDYRLFHEPFDTFDAILRKAGVGSHGALAAHHLREALRRNVTPGAEIRITRGRKLNVGGIGEVAAEPGILRLNSRDTVNLTIPLRRSGNRTEHLLLLHDYPNGRATSCLMPSVYAPETEVTGSSVTLPLTSSGHLTFPVGGQSGYRCLYAIQSATDLADHIGLKDVLDDLGLPAVEAGVLNIETHHMAALVDVIENASGKPGERVHIAFAEYLLD